MNVKELETVATVKFGRILTLEEKKNFEDYIDTYGPTSDVEFYEEET